MLDKNNLIKYDKRTGQVQAELFCESTGFRFEGCFDWICMNFDGFCMNLVRIRWPKMFVSLFQVTALGRVASRLAAVRLAG